MTIFFRLLDAEDKGTALQGAIAALPQNPTPEAFAVNPESFEQVPGAPFAYWLGTKSLALFAILPRFEQSDRILSVGLQTSDDFRFLRSCWEIPPEIPDWSLFIKGGGYSPFYGESPLVVAWKGSGHEIKNFDRAYIRNENLYFRKGITWSRRPMGNGSFRSLRRDCIFGINAPSMFSKYLEDKEVLSILSILNSKPFNYLLQSQFSRGGSDSSQTMTYEIGYVGNTPFPKLSDEEVQIFCDFSRRAWSLKRNLDTITQTSHAFILPALLQVQGATLSQRAQAWATTVANTEQELAKIQAEIDTLAFELYGISPEEVGAEEPGARSQELEAEDADDEDEDAVEGADLPSLVHGLIEYALGVALGRFDIRLATGERPHPPEPEPFDPLPACSPGMLVVERSQESGARSQEDVDSTTSLSQHPTTHHLPPTSTAELPANYPIDIPFNGILVDDEGHPNDIVTHVRQVLDLIWGDQAGDIEQEACQILKVASLRDYIAKPNAFFAEHLSRYSKSRRQAPIYWPLSTRSGSYTLWLYYHRLTDQTLYTGINDFVEPKLHQVTQTTTQLRSQPSRTRDEDKRLETLQSLELELIEFRDELLRIAQLPYKPNLNDGVQITAAPLWPLFGLKKWQTKLKDTWKKLEKGDYDWAHLAYSIWPERVREKCKGDRSLAIAHDLEKLHEEPMEKLKTSKHRRKS